MFSNTMYSKEVLIDSLTVVKDKALNGEYKNSNSGICCKWSDMIDEDNSVGYDIVEVFSPSWEHFSGENCLPILGYTNGNLWKGEQLKLRLSLIDHILKCLEEVDQEWLDKLYEDSYTE